MEVTNKNTLTSWFRRGAKPLASQFAAWINSYWHKEEKIPVSSIEKLSEILGNKIDRTEIENITSKLLLERRLTFKVYTSQDEIFIAEPMNIYGVVTKNISSLEISGSTIELVPIDGHDDVAKAAVNIDLNAFELATIVTQKQLTDPDSYFYIFAKVKPEIL